jgi:hypothetical protein
MLGNNTQTGVKTPPFCNLENSCSLSLKESIYNYFLYDGKKTLMVVMNANDSEKNGTFFRTNPRRLM